MRGHPFWFVVAFTLGAVAVASTPSGPGAPLLAASRSALGVDVDVYTGPVARDVWRRMKRANVEVVVAQTWGGRSRNEFAASQLAGARRAGLKTAAYVLLNYDNRVCPTHASPVRDAYGRCMGEPVEQDEPGGRWQVQQGLAALEREFATVAFVAIDVEWFLQADPASDGQAQALRRQSIVDAVNEVRRRGKAPVIYTRNARRHWTDITGCHAEAGVDECADGPHDRDHPLATVPLWDVERGEPELDGFEPYGHWTSRAGRQYQLDVHRFGLPKRRTVDLNVFDPALFTNAR